MKMAELLQQKMYFFTCNPTALRTAKTPKSFGRSECNRVKGNYRCINGVKKMKGLGPDD